MNHSLRFFLFFVFFVSRVTSTGVEPAFEDIASSAGFNIMVRSGSSEKKYLVETMTGGVCLIDFDNDGYLDVYVVNGSDVQSYLANKPGFGNRLYRNERNGRFSDVTVIAGVASASDWGMGCSVADFDGDGFADLYVTKLGRNALYRNNRNGRFSDVSRSSGTDHVGWSTGSVWGDFDKDGWLDLYVVNYVDFDFNKAPEPGSGENCKYLGIDVACGPRGLRPAANVFFRNSGNGTFSDETELRGLKTQPSYGLGACAADYDNDSDLDIFVANDSKANYLLQNQGEGKFKEVALLSGVAYNEDGNAQASMGTDFADYDNDGYLDLIVTNFARDTNTLYHNERNGTFKDSTTRGSQRDSYPYMSWGVGFVDFDNDGLKDLFVVNGHLYPQIDRLKNEIGYRQRDLCYRNLGDGRFLNLSSRLNHGGHVGRGAAFGDLDNDGRIDVVISNLDDRLNVLMNRDGSKNNWILIRCIGSDHNREAIGARISVTTAQGTQTREVRAGCSYLSSSDRRVHFGLGKAKIVTEILVAWPSGERIKLSNVPVNQVLTIKEPD